MNRGVDPSAALRKEYGKRVRNDSAALGLWKKHHLAVRESANKACRQEAIFTKEQQIFLVQRGDFALAIWLTISGLMISGKQTDNNEFKDYIE
jgi:hypothetical protein